VNLGVAMWPYWDLRWRETFGTKYLAAVLGSAGPTLSPHLRAWALTAMADLVASHGEATLATQWAGEAVGTFREQGDHRGLATALMASGAALTNGGALGAADVALDEALALARGLDDRALTGLLLSFSSLVAGRRGDHRRAEHLGREELETWTALDSRRGEAHALRHLAVTMRNLGDLDQTRQLCGRALVILRRREDAASVAHCIATLADLARLGGDPVRAHRLYETALDEFRLVGDRRCTAATYVNLAELARTHGDRGRSSDLARQAVRIRHQLGDHAGMAECCEALAADLAALGRPAETVDSVLALDPVPGRG
jgi:tetratricopeptide (TPR) repeat protein